MPKLVGIREKVGRVQGAWGAPRRGLGRISARTRSGMASGVMSVATYSLGIPAAIGAGVAYLKKKDEETIVRWAIWGGLIGLGVQVGAAALGLGAFGVGAWLLRRRAQQEIGAAAQSAGIGRC